MIYISLTMTSGSPEFQVVDTNSVHRERAAFDATRNGLVRMGRFIANRWGSDTDASCSSDLDFPQEFGIEMTADEIRGAIDEGMVAASLDTMEAKCGWFSAADER